MTFDQALEYLLRLGHETLAIKFGLENTKYLLKALGDPQRSYPKVQIAGTNGKGSTAVMLEAICRKAGIKTGVYTSPHLESITERVRVDGREISKEDFALLTAQVSNAAQKLVKDGLLASLPTFFEHVTAIALLAFHEANVELGILETGLGGRLDATTAACAGVVAITPISLDHQEYLGRSQVEIAAEKAAVIRPGVTAVIGPQPNEVMTVILERCEVCSVHPALVNDSVDVVGVDSTGRLIVTARTKEDVYENVKLNLAGRHQAVNASIAIGIAEALRARGFDISRDAIIAGLEIAEHPGRLEWRDGQPAFLFDGAHNVAGAIALREYLDEFVKRPITLIFGAMRDKDLLDMASALFPVADRIVLTQMNNERSASHESLMRLAPHEIDAGRVTFADNVNEALLAALEQTPSDGLICVTGSLYLIGEVQASLRHEEHASYSH